MAGTSLDRVDYIQGGLNSKAGHLVTAADITKRGYFLTAFRYGYGTAGMEMAATRRVQGTGHLTLDNNTLTFLLDNRIGNRYRRKQGPGVGMEGVFIQLRRVSNLNDATQVHDGDAVAD